jgi:regulator of sirC expression with transglutaminase-like and TPR domain
MPAWCVGDMLSAVFRLRRALQNDFSEVALDIAALELASIEFPGLDFEPTLFRLDNFADQVRSELSAGATGLGFIAALNEVLFEALQFHGNESDYYDPRNSCLNSVVSRRLGIPISLSIVYMEVARRLSRRVSGIGLPGHFIVMYEDENSRYWIDPFNRGRLLSYEDCCKLALDTAGVDLRTGQSMLSPVSNRQLLIRMLTNMKLIYLRGQALDKARQVIDLLIHARPEDAEEYRLRGLIYLQQLNHRAAKTDFESYLKLVPANVDPHQVQQQLVLIERWKAGLN